ncbi:MazG [Synechococcus phage S-CBM2]|nr:MazG [Synechococcus phage S-CBM2]
MAEKKFIRPEADFAQYQEFVKSVTSSASSDTDAFIERIEELASQGCDVQRLLTAGVGIAAEGGEFSEIVKKMVFQGKPWNDDNKKHLLIELGDVMWYVMQACTALGVNLDEVVIQNTFKLLARYPEAQFSVDRSENRAEGDL